MRVRTALPLCLAFVLTGMTVAPSANPDLAPYGLAVELPDDWTTTEQYDEALPNFGVYMAESEAGGYFWVQVMGLSSDGVSKPMPEALDDGVTAQPFADDLQMDGFVDGHVREKDGLPNYFFVATHGAKAYRFRVGYSFEKTDLNETSAAAAREVAQGILKSLAFTE
ncbi:MAG: hypothetical protein AAGJ10_10625 [Bacteroidota bacterium]